MSREKSKEITDKEFMELCENGTSAEVLAAIEAATGVPGLNDAGRTALMRAVADRNLFYFFPLLERGADVNQRDAKGRTALMYLYAHHFAYPRPEAPDDSLVLEILDELLYYGADVNAADDDGMTALMYAAAQTATPEVLTVLLGAGADPQAKDKLGLGAFDYAMKNDALRGMMEFALHTFSGIEKAAADGRTKDNKEE